MTIVLISTSVDCAILKKKIVQIKQICHHPSCCGTGVNMLTPVPDVSSLTHVYI